MGSNGNPCIWSCHQYTLVTVIPSYIDNISKLEVHKIHITVMITKQLQFIKSSHMLSKASDILNISSLILPTTLGVAAPQFGKGGHMVALQYVFKRGALGYQEARRDPPIGQEEGPCTWSTSQFEFILSVSMVAGPSQQA